MLTDKGIDGFPVRPRPIDAGLKTVRTNPLRNTTRNKALIFCHPHPNVFGFPTGGGWGENLKI